MKTSLGIVGLPNVGKSTLFNTLTRNAVPAENYPFCTIDPNVGVVEVNDPRLSMLAEIVKPEKIVKAVVEFVDIAGLIEGAHKGEGLGNQFLTNIRETDGIVHVVRNFVSDKIVHVNNEINPKRDIEIINLELILKDLETVEKRLDKLKRELKTQKDKWFMVEWLEGLQSSLQAGHLAYDFAEGEKSEDIIQLRKSLSLLTDKPVLYLINMNTTEDEAALKEKLGLKSDANVIIMDIGLEFELSIMSEEERVEYMKELGIEETGIDRLIHAAYKLLGLQSFFTAGVQEVRAWTINIGDDIRQSAGKIHNDFMEKFIKADVVAYEDFINNKGWEGSKLAGKLRQEGKEYITRDGDVVIFKHGA